MNNKLNGLLSDLVVFYHKLQSFHWYVSGPTFFQTHPALEEYYNEVLPQIDDVAEIILQLNGKPVSSVKEFLELSTIEEGKDEFNTDIKEIFNTVRLDYSYLLGRVTEIKEAADQESNYLVSAKMDEFIGTYSKNIWMLNQYSR